MKTEHVEQINSVVSAVKEKDINNIYFVACGGSLASLSTGDYFVDRELSIPSKAYTSNEFIHSNPKGLGNNSLVILRSHSGTTPETVEAAKFAREKGAITVAISIDTESPLCQEAEYTVHYNYKDGSDAIDGEIGIFYTLVFSIINSLNPNEKYERVLDQLNKLEELFDSNQKLTYERAFQFGKENKREKIIYTMGSGAYYHQAYSFTSCLLMEMLWINSNAIHTGEYFHGPFEITDFDVPFLIIKGEGPTLPLDERAISFAEKFSEKVEVVDITKLDYSGIDEDLKEYFGPALAGVVLRQYADGLSEHTGHPLSVRRYMWKMEY
ncbi:Fructoselysine 6-phosphate deglycase [Lentibacillus sp. JNUCC-1]|uniref:SIS domain-containing protein n=1 Tax=Lentibacillus sp. JNUCC-1 TaxID=2654513 RepID=UPI0012E85FB4|nr:SIS domain-containing protein [Lentibacillus sp. JNUCC-1]MUV37216.1 Fructoselysine 6-phosphate deglycase [Lentibacillus sp. JNUCC-1]